MASTQAIKRRIRSVKSTQQITKAMELVAASKMRHAQEATLASRAYRNTAREIITRLSELTEIKDNPLWSKRKIKTKLYVVIASDRGLAGAYNNNVLKQLLSEIGQDQNQGVRSQVIAIGRRSADTASRLNDVELIGAYEQMSDRPTADDIRPVLNTAIELFTTKKVDAVDIVYTDYISSIRQEPIVERILPAHFVATDDRKDLQDAVFEPSPQEVLTTITPRLIEIQLYQALLEAQASEHSMRMMAMKNASDNAKDLTDDLNLAYNSARQASITQELAEIIGGSEAIK